MHYKIILVRRVNTKARWDIGDALVGRAVSTVIQILPRLFRDTRTVFHYGVQTEREFVWFGVGG